MIPNTSYHPILRTSRTEVVTLECDPTSRDDAFNAAAEARGMFEGEVRVAMIEWQDGRPVLVSDVTDDFEDAHPRPLTAEEEAAADAEAASLRRDAAFDYAAARGSLPI